MVSCQKSPTRHAYAWRVGNGVIKIVCGPTAGARSLWTRPTVSNKYKSALVQVKYAGPQLFITLPILPQRCQAFILASDLHTFVFSNQWSTSFCGTTEDFSFSPHPTLTPHPHPWTKWPPFLNEFFSLIKMREFRIKYHWCLFPGIKLTISHDWFR